MKSKQLFDLTKNLFDKHPSAKPECILYFQIKCDPNDSFWCLDYDNSATLEPEVVESILTGHLTKWLAERLEFCPFNIGQFQPEIGGYAAYGHSGDTLIEALISACMEVEQ